MADVLVVVGAGGFGRETIDVVRAVNAASLDLVWTLVGVVDDAPSQLNLARLDALGVAYLGKLDSLAGMAGAAVAVAVGSPSARMAIAARVEAWGLGTPNLVHPTAVIGNQVTIRDGVIVCASASVGTNATIGRHVHLNPHAVIGHDTTIDDFVSVNPSATVSGDCVIESRAMVGAASVVLQGLKVGAGATVGGGACVVRDVPTGAVVKGVPAR